MLPAFSKVMCVNLIAVTVSGPLANSHLDSYCIQHSPSTLPVYLRLDHRWAWDRGKRAGYCKSSILGCQSLCLSHSSRTCEVHAGVFLCGGGIGSDHQNRDGGLAWSGSQQAVRLETTCAATKMTAEFYSLMNSVYHHSFMLPGTSFEL